MATWLMKSEPDVFSIHDLRRDGRTMWDGIRNYQARNFMRDDMKVGDLVLYYHSNANPSGVAGLGRVVSEPYADPTQFDPASAYHDPASTPDAPRWVLVDVGFGEAWADVVSLAELKAEPALEGLETTRRGSRLSIHPVSEAHAARILEMGRAKGAVLR
jgi:predicted RNA-binding protein with PUA-like domain